MTTKRFILMLLVTLMSVTGTWAIDNVPYVDMEVTTDAEGHVTVTPVTKYANNVVEMSEINLIGEQVTTLDAGWYVITGNHEFESGLICNGDVHLILADESQLTIYHENRTSGPGIQVSGEGNSLTIYGQENQSGELIARGRNGAGIGGGEYVPNITINGGKISAYGNSNKAGIGGGEDYKESHITINGGEVTARGSQRSAGIGSRVDSSFGDIFRTNITINGGVVKATSGDRGAAIGSGNDIISFNGGRVTAEANSPLPSACAIGATPYHVHVDDLLILKADNNNPPIEGIDTDDLEHDAVQLFGRRYATVEPRQYIEDVPYVDAGGNPQTAQIVFLIDSDASEQVTWTHGWYVVTGEVTLSKGAICRSNVNLILADDAKLTLIGAENEAGIRVSDLGATLTIYGQTNQSGQLIATGGDGAAGIGGSLNRVGRNIRINGGIVKANGGTGAPAVGGYGIVDEFFNEELPASNIFVNSLLTVHADNNNPPTTEIEHTSTDDLASVLSDKRYLTAQHFHHFAESREEGAAYYTCACGYIDLVRQHVHNYKEEWSTDGTRHWHECTSEVGTCIAPIVDEGEHNYDNSAVEGTMAYYSCGTCGHIDPVRQHVHNYEWVVVDEHLHKQVCTSEVGTCIARERNEGEHNIHESILCDTENYLCDVCDYVDEAKKAQFGERDYMSMTAVGGDVTVGFKKVGSPADYTIQISADGNHWSERQTLTATTELATIPDGETYYFRHGKAEAIDRISRHQDHHWSFTMTSHFDNATVEAGGNIMSLLDMTCQKTSMTFSIQHVFTGLFQGCDLLTIAPNLQFTSIAEFCYMYMFEGTGITTAPQLPATTVRDGSYMGMFRNCKNLENVSPLPGTTLRRRAYEEMFKGCEKLTSVEIVNITSMDERTDASNACFTNWLQGTAAETNGKVIAPVEMMGHALVFLPSNWQWATKLKLNEDPTFGEEGNFYTTFYDSRYDYVVKDGFKAYSGIVASGDDDDELRLTPTPDNIIPKGNGVLLHGGSDEVLLTVSDEGASTIPDNVLTGSDENTPALANCYILSYGQNGLGFYRCYAEGKSLSAHKAYLTYQHGSAQARAMRMVFADDNEVDGIQRIENGESEIENSVIYNLNGMRLNKLQKGINIVNGKKIIVK